MSKRKEIKFRRDYRELIGQQDGVVYRIYTDPMLDDNCTPACTVSAYDTKKQGRTISTAGYRTFHLADAKELCQQISAGEIDLEALRVQFAAEDQRKEQEAIRTATEQAKAFRDKLEAVGISYSTLLELEAMRGNLGNIGHNILIGWERGEEAPTC